MVKTNPTENIDISFCTYIDKRKALTEAHMEGGIPDYAYGVDYTTRQKIRAVPGAFALFKALTGQVVPRMKQITNMNSLKVGTNQFSDIYEITLDCARRLGIGVPTVFVESNSALNAYTIATEDDAPIIVINSGLLERMTPGEVKAVIGHECGHIHNNHGIYNTAAYTILSQLGMNIPFIGQIMNLLTIPLKMALSAWSRAAEVTCDRAGVICCDDPLDALRVNAKFTYGAAFNRDDVNIDAILKQYDVLRGTPVRLLEAMSNNQQTGEIGLSHPIPVRRIFAEQAFLDSEVLYSWRPDWKQPGKVLISKQELDARCEKYIGVIKSEKRRNA